MQINIIQTGEDSWTAVQGRVPWTAKRLNKSIRKELNPEYSLEGLTLNLKPQYFGHLMQRVASLEKTLMLGKTWRQQEKRTTEDAMAGWHRQLNGHEFQQIFLVAQMVKNLPAIQETWVKKIPWSRRSPGERNGRPLQYSSLGSPMNRGAWRAAAHEAAKNPTQLRLSQTLGDSEGQCSPECRSPWGLQGSNTTEWLNSNTITILICLFPVVLFLL